MVNGVSNMLKLISCGTTPMQDLATSNSLSMSWPNTSTTPLVLLTSEVVMPIRRGLAGAVWAQQREEIALVDVEIYRLERFDAVFVDLGELAEDEGMHRSRVD